MEDFVFYSPTKIIFGRNSENRVGQEIKNICRRVLFVYGKESIKKSGLYDRVKESLEKAGIDYVELPGVMANPRLELVRKGIEYCRKYNLGFILAVGGGSVID
ncbi:MAG: iron-containing alcohol dehydrogenase, partial [Actinobacteria bacterium]|nr:iron-containing alcohol dehydrogenase [Actinomycetota bacterium]